MQERHKKILEIVNNRQKISVAELSALTGVSVVTIRNDLTTLEEQNYIKRSHGFAEMIDPDVMMDRIHLNFSLKQRLAQYALQFIQDGDSVFIEGGSTNAFLARELANFKGELVVVTVCTYIASLLKEAEFDVILLGGLLQSKSESVIGPLTRLCIKHTHFNKAFLGIDGYSKLSGFTGRDMMRADVINAVLHKGAQNYVIADSSKFGVIFPYALESNHINHIITDEKLDNQLLRHLQQKNISVHKI